MLPVSISPTPRLDLTGVSKRFGNVIALDDVSLAVAPGSIHALLGENGAGKTTLMRIAYGIMHPDSGAISVDGRQASIKSPADAIAAGIGMVHQQFSLVPAMTVAENVALGGRGRFDIRQIVERIESIGERTGLRLNPLAVVADLGAAERQKLEIVRTLAHDARTLILDEPTAVLTQSDIGELFSQLRSFADNGGTVILITHKLRDAATYADQVTVLRKGRRVLSAPMADVTEEQIADAMLGEGTQDQRDTEQVATVGDRVVLSLSGVRLDALNEGQVDLQVRAGEIVGIAALDGTAKGIIEICAGRRQATNGSVKLPSTIGFVPESRQEEALIPDFTLAENLALRGSGSRSGVLDWQGFKSGTLSLIDRFDIRANGPGSRARELSGGNQQRFVLGRELMESPELLVLENPTQGLDIKATAAVHARMRGAARRGTAILFYSSDLDELADLATRVIVVRPSGAVTAVPERDTIGQLLLESDAPNSA